MFLEIAKAGSFTQAAARLHRSPSALSHALRSLEARLNVKLLDRTTRSVAPTASGRELLAVLEPAFKDVEAAVERLSLDPDRPAGHVRISSPRTTACRIIAPRLWRLHASHPDITVELSVEDRRIDIVAEGFDAGVRSGALVAKDMISVRLSPDDRFTVVVAPAHLQRTCAPASPEDLAARRCISYRHLDTGILHRWAFARGRRTASIEIKPAFVTNDVDLMIEAAVQGAGYAYALHSQVEREIESGALISVLDDWCPARSGDFLYFTSRRHHTPAFRAVVEALRLKT